MHILDLLKIGMKKWMKEFKQPGFHERKTIMRGNIKKYGKKVLAILCAITLIVSCLQGIEKEMSEVKASDSGTYTELTFKNFGIPDKEFNATYSSESGILPSVISSWNKVRVVGEVTIDSEVTTSDAALLLFGGDSSSVNWNNPNGGSKGLTLHIQQSGVDVRFANANRTPAETKQDGLITASELTDAGINLSGEAFQIAVEIIYVGESDAEIRVIITQGVNSVGKTCRFENIQSYMSTNFAISSWQAQGKVTFVSVIEYTELTLKNFGIPDKEFNATYSSESGILPSVISSWNKVRVSGAVTIGSEVTTSDAALLLFGGDSASTNWNNPNGSSKGLTVHIQQSGVDVRFANAHRIPSETKQDGLITASELTTAGINLSGETIQVITEILYVGESNVEFTLILAQGENSIEKTCSFENIQSYMSKNFAISSWQVQGKVTFASVFNYQELTFSDMNIADRLFEASYASESGKLPTTIQLWNMIRVVGEVTIDSEVTTSDAALLLFGGDSSSANWNNPNGGSKGLTLHIQQSGVDVRFANAHRTPSETKQDGLITASELTTAGINLSGETVRVTTEIIYVGENNVEFTVILVQGENSIEKTCTFENIQSYMSTNFAISSWQVQGNVLFASVLESHEPEQSEITELTFVNLGIADKVFDKTYSSESGVLPSTVTSWDKVRVVGEVTIGSEVTVGDAALLLFGGDSSSANWNNPNGGSKGLTLHIQQSGVDVRFANVNRTPSETKQDGLITASELTTAGINLSGETVRATTEIIYVGENNVEVTVILAQGENSIQKICTFENIQSYMSTNFAISSWQIQGKVTFGSVIEYTDVTFSDCGIEDKTFGGNALVGKGTFENITSLDKVRFQGALAFTTSNDWHLMIGGKADSYNDALSRGVMLVKQEGGFALRCTIFDDNGNQTYHQEPTVYTARELESAGITYEEQPMFIEMTFLYTGTDKSDLQVGLTISNGVGELSGKTVTFEDVTSELTTNLAFNGYWSDGALASVTSTADESAEYDLINGDYVITSDATILALDGGLVSSGKTITEAGTYNLMTVQNGVLRKTTLVVTETLPPGPINLTFSDCGIEDAEFNTGNTGRYIGKAPANVTSLDRVVFKGMFAFTYYNDPNLMIGGEAEHYGEEKTRGIMLVKQGTSIGLRCQIYKDGARTYNREVDVYTAAEMEEAGISFTNQPLLVTMSFTYTGDSKENVVVSLDVSNGVNSLTGKTVTFENVTADLTTNVVFNSQSSAGKIASVSTEKELTAKSYSLNDGAYLFDTAGHITAINGALTDRGAELKKAGTYTLMGVVDGVVSTRIVSLYALGDMDLSAVINDDGNVANTISSKELVIIKKCIADESKYTQAHLKAADLSNDNLVDEDDAKAMRQVLVGEIALGEYYPAAMSYEYLGGDEVMPLSGYFGPYAKDGMNYLTDEIYSALSDANINLVVSSSQDYMDGVYAGEDFNGAQAVTKALQLSEKYKMGMYVLNSNLNFIYATGETATNKEIGNQYNKTYNVMERDRYITTGAEAANYLANYSYFDSYLGTMVRDEPCTATFPATNQALLDSGNRLEWYSDVASILNSYSNSFGYLNAQCYSGRNKDNPSLILGNISEDWEDESSVALYTEYLNEILTTTKIPVLSYDNYMYGNGVDGKKRSAQDANTWIVNLDTVRTVAKKNDTGKEVPFWTQVAAGGYFDGDSTTISSTDNIMTQAQFNWQVNVPLAFGAKGITYFPLIQPSDFANAGDLDNNLTRNGMINTEYETTKWYTYAKELNEQITSVDHVLMKADNKGIIISDGTDSYAYGNMVGISFQQTGSNWFRPYSVKDYTLGAYEETDPQGRVTNFTSSNTKYGAIAGVFSYQGKTAYYVVNWSDVTTGTDTVTLTFDKATNYTVIQNAKETAKSGDTCQLSLAAGEGVLVVLNN